MDKITQSCIYCGGELKPVEDFFKNDNYEIMKEKFKGLTGMDWKESPDFNCAKCGEVYDETFTAKGYKIEWLGKELKNVAC